MKAGILGILAASALPLLAGAAPHRLDDSASQVIPPVADWQWVPLTARGNVSLMEMSLQVRARIDMRPWLGQSGRVYMVMGPEAGPAVTATWQAQGRLRGGQLRAGERALVYEGKVDGPWLEDVLRVRLVSDTRIASPLARQMEFRFEFDTP